MLRRLLILSVALWISFVGTSGASTSGPHWAGWFTNLSASAGSLDEAWSTMTVPTPNPLTASVMLTDWVGLNGPAGLFQAGVVTLPSGSNCFWEDYPAGAVDIPGVRCAPGDSVFVDIDLGYFGPGQSQVNVQDMTTGQVVHVQVPTPNVGANPQGQLFLEGNAWPGNWPTSFSTVTFTNPTWFYNGYFGKGGKAFSLLEFAYVGAAQPYNDLLQVIPTTVLSPYSPNNVETVSS